MNTKLLSIFSVSALTIIVSVSSAFADRSDLADQRGPKNKILPTLPAKLSEIVYLEKAIILGISQSDQERGMVVEFKDISNEKTTKMEVLPKFAGILNAAFVTASAVSVACVKGPSVCTVSDITVRADD